MIPQINETWQEAYAAIYELLYGTPPPKYAPSMELTRFEKVYIHIMITIMYWSGRILLPIMLLIILPIRVIWNTFKLAWETLDN